MFYFNIKGTFNHSQASEKMESYIDVYGDEAVLSNDEEKWLIHIATYQTEKSIILLTDRFLIFYV